jgi:Ca-activated chloride channel family protein
VKGWKKRRRKMYRFKFWYYLFLLIPVFIAGYYVYRKYKQGREGIVYSDFLLDMIKPTFKEKLFYVVRWFPLVAAILAVVALGRPQSGKSYEKQTTEGIDIVLCLDTSSSMKALDFKPDNRFTVAKNTMLDFVSKRKFDRMAFVPFAGYAITKCPLTTDHRILKKIIEDTKLDSIEDGTAIGMALATGINRLKHSKAKSKIIILLTDGVNNRGSIDPKTAAEIARDMGIKIYAVGVGTKGYAEYPQKGPFGLMTTTKAKVDIDEKMLKEITDLTGGEYFRATDSVKLKNIYSIIDKMEKTKIELKTFTLWKDLYFYPLVLSFIFLFAYTLINGLYLRVKQ